MSHFIFDTKLYNVTLSVAKSRYNFDLTVSLSDPKTAWVGV